MDLQQSSAVVTLVQNGQMAAAEVVSPDRTQGVRRVHKRVTSPTSLQTGDFGILWKRNKSDGEASTSHGNVGEIVSTASYLSSDRGAQDMAQGLGLDAMDVDDLQSMISERYLRNISKQWHARKKTSENAQLVKAYNAALRQAKASGRIKGHYQAHASAAFNIEVRNVLKERQHEGLSPGYRADLEERLKIAKQVIDNSSALPGLGNGYVNLEQAYSSANDDLHQTITPAYVQRVQSLAARGVFKKIGDGVEDTVLKMVQAL
ncbi:hypothetical protein KFL_002360040 [Klebsormidium nitens]|uniref:Uncharacterized protein n=1 Tax=Klebsormidium nitens TaxID=105231 RepID=A0A0U9HK35_KLENI|nr:hypothetical protein KFL_002360040 [Klebsormidium nitens]|eukprot:GAQ85451.1 hypothetical protein KFL_002360040 [Klebsormidium nitens]